MIAITGNHNTGKTTLLKKIKEKGFSTLEVDFWVGEQYKKGTKIFDELIKTFGESIILNNKINKKELKKLILSDFSNLKKIELIVHPHLYKHLLENKYDFVEIPIIKWSPIDFTKLFNKIINLVEINEFSKTTDVDNFYNILIDTNNRTFRTLETVDIYAKNIKNIDLFLKKYGITNV